jgi:uncharacterized protein with NAD-binding domain and iron-sulfur cluster
MTEEKMRVAILDGGVGALSAAFALSEIDPTGERYEITLYQLGWRLGSKLNHALDGAGQIMIHRRLG